MIELFEQNERMQNRQSSKGNQLKWENAGIWYKADYTGYEGMAEYMISHLLIKSTLKPEEFVRYDLEEIKYKRQVYQGVKSRTFLSEDWQIITLERLFQKMYGNSLNQMLWQMDDAQQRLRFLEEQVERMTGLRGFGIYLNKLLTIDAIFLNEDRHTHNIAVLMNGAGMFKYCPIFDNGGGLLSDTTLDYPLGEDPFDLIKEVQAKTVSSDFDEQLDASERLYGDVYKRQKAFWLMLTSTPMRRPSAFKKETNISSFSSAVRSCNVGTGITMGIILASGL